MKIYVYAKIVCLALFITGSVYSNQNWPTYRGNDQRTGITNAKVTTPLKRPWVHSAIHAPNPSWPKPAKQDFWHRVPKLSSTTIYDRVFHPIIFDSKVAYASSTDNTIYCLDVKTGQELWHFITNGPVRIAPAYRDGKLYVGSDDGYLYCLNSSNGKLVWKFWAGDDSQRLLPGNSRLISRQPVRTGVVFKDNFVYVVAGLFSKESIYLSAVNFKTGEAKYKKKINYPAQGYITLFDDKLSFPVGRTSQAVFDIQTGKNLFRFAPGSNAVVYGNLFFSGVDERGFGKLFYVDGIKTILLNKLRAHQITVIDNVLYIFSNNYVTAFKKDLYVKVSKKLNILYKVKRKQRDDKWKVAEKAAINVRRNTRLWRAPIKKTLSVVATPDKFFIGCQNKVVALSKQDGKIIWAAKIDGNIYGLAVAENRLIASSDKGSIYCFIPDIVDETVSKVLKKKSCAVAYKRNYDPSLLNSWIFSESNVKNGEIVDKKGVKNVAVPPLATLANDKKNSYIKLSGKSSMEVADERNMDILPKESFSIEAIVSIAKPLKWGGIIGAFQDNGAVEHGWVLGYQGKRFMFGLRGAHSKKLTYLKANIDFKLNAWYHLLATYDGSEMVIYMNGKKVASSQAQKGEICYSKNFYYDIASYHDDNENHKMSGRLLEVALYSKALSSATAAEMANTLKPWMPEIKTAVSKAKKKDHSILFNYDGTCTISFTHKMSEDTKIAYGTDRDNLDQLASQKNSLAIIKNLQPQTRYYFAILSSDNKQSIVYEMLTPHNPFIKNAKQNPAVKVANTILKKSGFNKGYCYILDCDDGELAFQLAARSNLQIIGIENDPVKAEKIREKFRKLALYGTRITVFDSIDLKKLPSKTANIVTSGKSYKDNKLPVRKDKLIKRLLRPNGGTSIFVTDNNIVLFKRPGLKGAGNWDHIYADRGGSANSNDTLISPEMEIQWFGPPGPNRMADRHHRQMPPLYSNGNLFILGDNYLYGVDGYNGTVLWERGIPKSRRLGIMYDTAIMAASPDRLYIGSNNKCLALGARSGLVEASFDVPYKNEEMGYIAIDKDILILSSQPQNASWNKRFRNNDLMEGDFRPIACSRALFSYDVKSGKLLWRYRKGIIFNPAIVQSEDTIYFLESRNPALLQKPNGRFGIKDLLADGYGFLVALDIKTGEIRWKQKMDLPYTNIIFLNYSAGVLVASGSYNVEKNVKYELVAYSAQDGSFKWRSDSSLRGAKIKGAHGEQWQHPAIVDGGIFLQGHVIDLQTGKPKQGRKAWYRSGGGCGTIACSAEFSFQRYNHPTQKNLKTGVLSKLTLETRPGCWINMIPAGGMVLIPEASSGCTCAYSIQASIAMAPKEKFEK
ncbi:MAG: PQQ-binding-like beta-propeller repeat protein [Verrucomicrobiota bacterium]|nr:PQQ-binding-like beta-propeller repeat protein [Verrucomicrobiota bacterium]